MMKNKLIYSILLSFFMLSACKKEELPSNISSEPVFGAEFVFDGEEFSLEAGRDGIAQTISFELGDSSIALNSSLSRPACENCGPAVSLRLQSPEGYIYNGTSQFPDDILGWDIRMQQEAEVTNTLFIRANTGNTNLVGLWELNGISLGNFPSDSVSFTITDAGSYSLLFTHPEDTCATTAAQNITWDGSTVPCYGNIQRMIPDSLEQFVADPGPGFDLANTTYTWFFGDSILSTGNLPLVYFFAVEGYDEVCVDMFDPSGCSAQACMSAVPNSSFCDAAVHITSAEIFTDVPENDFAKLIITYTNADGALYSSDNENQANAVVGLISLEPYTEPTKPNEQFSKAVFQIDCTLFDENGVGFPFTGTLEMAIGYP